LKNKATYIPSSITGDKPKALIPLNPQTELSKKALPKRLIVTYGTKPTDIGLLVVTPGSAVNEMVTVKANYSTEDLESELSQVLVTTLFLVDAVKVSVNGNRVIVEIQNPHLENRKMRVYEIIGSPIASIVASIITEVTNKPVKINAESCTRNKTIFELFLLENKP
jgi:hypothetical protein